jgi:hypothetical protein
MKSDSVHITRDSLDKLLAISKKYAIQNQSFDWTTFGTIILIIIISGLIGGCVNYYYGLKQDSENDKVNSLNRSIIVGIGAAMIVPIFLQITQSNILNGLRSQSLNDYILFISFCVLAGISSTRFITSVSDSVLSRIGELESKQVQVEKKQEQVERKTDTIAAVTQQRIGTKTSEITKQLIQVTNTEIKSQSRNLDDPHKGEYGDREDNDFKVSVDKIPDPNIKGWYNLTYKVVAKDPSKTKLEGKVRFHLHPTFTPDVETVDVINGVAKLNKIAWGAFTIGVEILSTGSKLELDLGDEPDLPDDFKNR